MLKYTPERGQIIVDAEQHGLEICLAVHDNGIGIAAEICRTSLKNFTVPIKCETLQIKAPDWGWQLLKNLVELNGGKSGPKAGLAKGLP
jgi:K+-sensing histidine kinase KdpD